jgi:hypothetical protein
MDRKETVEIAGKEVFMINVPWETGIRAIHSIRLYWEPDSGDAEPCGYDVYVYDERMSPLFKHHVKNSVFADKQKKSYEVPVPKGHGYGIRVFHVRLIPDFTEGKEEITTLRLSAVPLPKETRFPGK